MMLSRAALNDAQPRWAGIASPFIESARFISCPALPHLAYVGNVGGWSFPPTPRLQTAINYRAARGQLAQYVPSATDAIRYLRQGSETLNAFLELPTGTDWTFLIHIDDAGFSGTNPGIWRAGSSSDGTTFVIYQSTTRLWVRVNGTDFYGQSARPSAGSSITVVVSFSSGKWIYSAQNGRAEINTTTAVTTPALTGTSGITSFGRQATSESVTGNYALLGFWARALPPAQALELSRNPWQVFEAEPRTYFIPAAAPGGFQAAWARHRSGMIGAGLH